MHHSITVWSHRRLAHARHLAHDSFSSRRWPTATAMALARLPMLATGRSGAEVHRWPGASASAEGSRICSCLLSLRLPFCPPPTAPLSVAGSAQASSSSADPSSSSFRFRSKTDPNCQLTPCCCSLLTPRASHSSVLCATSSAPSSYDAGCWLHYHLWSRWSISSAACC